MLNYFNEKKLILKLKNSDKTIVNVFEINYLIL